MNVMCRLPDDLKSVVVSYLPPLTHTIRIVSMPMVFYNQKELSYVCFNIDVRNKSIWNLIRNFNRLRTSIHLPVGEWELVYTPWSRNKKHDNAVISVYGGLPESIIYAFVHSRVNDGYNTYQKKFFLVVVFLLAFLIGDLRYGGMNDYSA